MLAILVAAVLGATGVALGTAAGRTVVVGTALGFANRSIDGKITVDFPVTASGKLSGSDLRGKLNGGGETLVVRTGDGPIRLHRL